MAILAANYALGQMNLEHSYTSDGSHWNIIRTAPPLTI